MLAFMAMDKKWKALFEKRKAAVCKNKRILSNKRPPPPPTTPTPKHQKLISAPGVY